MALKLRIKQSINPSLVALMIAFSITACDQMERSSIVGSGNSHDKVESIKEAVPNEHYTFTLEDLEQQLKPLKAQIKRLENDLEDSQKVSESSLKKMDDRQWDATKLKEIISILREDNQDLRSQLKEYLAEIETLQSALNKTYLDCNKDIKINR